MTGAAVNVTLKWTPEQFKGAVAQAVTKGMRDAGMLAADIAVRQLGTNHGGKPSAPGSPPNTQTGRLRRAHYWELTRNPIGFRYGVLDSMAPHGKWLQGGTRHMAPRPWLQIPLMRYRKQLHDRFVRSATAVMKARAR